MLVQFRNLGDKKASRITWGRAFLSVEVPIYVEIYFQISWLTISVTGIVRTWGNTAATQRSTLNGLIYMLVLNVTCSNIVQKEWYQTECHRVACEQSARPCKTEITTIWASYTHDHVICAGWFDTTEGIVIQCNITEVLSASIVRCSHNLQPLQWVKSATQTIAIVVRIPSTWNQTSDAWW